jgi:hypothetical protein
VAVGSALALLRGIVGPGPVADAENGAVRVVRTLMGPDLSEKVIAPFIHAQLSQPKGGVAIGGLLAAWWLSSHLFMATSHALDYAYGVRDRRPSLVQRFIALGFALGSVAVVALTVELMVTGPLGDPDGVLARRLGIRDAYAVGWSILRWPVLLVTVIGFLVCLYRFSPNVRQSWTDCLPGACAGAVLWILAAAAFRFAAALGLAQLGGGGRRRPDRRDHRPGRQRRGGDGPVGLSRERGDPRGRRAQRRAARRPGARGRGGAEGRGVSAVLNDVPRVLTSQGQ